VPGALKQFTGSIQGVNFKSGSAELLASSFKVLDSAAKAFGEFPDLKVEVFGMDVGPVRANPMGVLFGGPAITMPGITDALAGFAPGQPVEFHLSLQSPWVRAAPPPGW